MKIKIAKFVVLGLVLIAGFANIFSKLASMIFISKNGFNIDSFSPLYIITVFVGSIALVILTIVDLKSMGKKWKSPAFLTLIGFAIAGILYSSFLGLILILKGAGLIG